MSKYIGYFYDNDSYHKKFNYICKNVLFKKARNGEKNIKCPLKKLNFLSKLYSKYTKNITNYHKSGISITSMKTLLKNINTKNNIKAIFFDFDQTITSHNGLFEQDIFLKIINILKKNNYSKKKIYKQYCSYWFGNYSRFKLFKNILINLKNKNIFVFIITANKKNVVSSFLNRINLLNLFTGIYSIQENKLEKYEIIKKLWDKI